MVDGVTQKPELRDKREDRKRTFEKLVHGSSEVHQGCKFVNDLNGCLKSFSRKMRKNESIYLMVTPLEGPRRNESTKSLIS